MCLSLGKKKGSKTSLCHIKMKGFPNSATSYKVKQCSALGIPHFGLELVVNLSKLSFFSSKITLKTLRKKLSHTKYSFLQIHLLTRIVERPLTGFCDLEQITDPFFFLISQNGEICCE